MTTKYANKTSVPVDRSMAQIRQMLAKNNADGVAIGETARGAAIQFVFMAKPYKFIIKYPDNNEDSIRYTNAGRERTDSQIISEIDGERRRLWRALVLYIKAAVEAHNNGLIDMKRSLMSHMVLPGGSTVYERIEGSLSEIDAHPQLLLN